MPLTTSNNPLAQYVIPIMGSYLAVRCHGHADDRRFAAAFARAWERLPPGVRRTLLTHWDLWETCPIIEVLDDWAGRRNDLGGRTLGEALHGGHQIRFLARAVDAMPDHILEALVGHELGHVQSFAAGGIGAPHHEAWVDFLTESWGFDIAALHKWALRWVRQQNGRC